MKLKPSLAIPVILCFLMFSATDLRARKSAELEISMGASKLQNHYFHFNERGLLVDVRGNLQLKDSTAFSLWGAISITGFTNGDEKKGVVYTNNQMLYNIRAGVQVAVPYHDHKYGIFRPRAAVGVGYYRFNHDAASPYISEYQRHVGLQARMGTYIYFSHKHHFGCVVDIIYDIVFKFKDELVSPPIKNKTAHLIGVSVGFAWKP